MRSARRLRAKKTKRPKFDPAVSSANRPETTPRQLRLGPMHPKKPALRAPERRVFSCGLRREEPPLGDTSRSADGRKPVRSRSRRAGQAYGCASRRHPQPAPVRRARGTGECDRRAAPRCIPEGSPLMGALVDLARLKAAAERTDGGPTAVVERSYLAQIHRELEECRALQKNSLRCFGLPGGRAL